MYEIGFDALKKKAINECMASVVNAMQTVNPDALIAALQSTAVTPLPPGEDGPADGFIATLRARFPSSETFGSAFAQFLEDCKRRAADRTFWPAKIIRETQTRFIRLIERTDVRKVKVLVQSFPAIVPKRYRNSEVVCELRDNAKGDDSDWWVVFT